MRHPAGGDAAAFRSIIRAPPTARPCCCWPHDPAAVVDRVRVRPWSHRGRTDRLHRQGPEVGAGRDDALSVHGEADGLNCPEPLVETPTIAPWSLMSYAAEKFLRACSRPILWSGEPLPQSPREPASFGRVRASDDLTDVVGRERVAVRPVLQGEKSVSTPFRSRHAWSERIPEALTTVTDPTTSPASLSAGKNAPSDGGLVLPLHRADAELPRSYRDAQQHARGRGWRRVPPASRPKGDRRS